MNESRDYYIPPPNACGHSPNQFACRETAEYWTEVIREQLKSMVGPLADSLTKTVRKS